MIEVILEINYIAIFMLIFMMVGLIFQARKTAYTWLMVFFFGALVAVLFSSWNTLPDRSYRYPELSMYDMPFMFWIGPFLYQLFNYSRTKGFSYYQLLHFAPGLIVGLLTIPYYRLPAEQKLYRLRDLFEGQILIYDVYFIIGVFITCGYVGYLVWSFRGLLTRSLIREEESLQFLTFVLAVGVLVTGFAVLAIVLGDYLFLRLSALGIAAGLHIQFILGFRYPALHESLSVLSVQRGTSQSALSTDLAHQIGGKLEEVMQTDKLYREESLSLSRLAAHVDISLHQLSQYLNKYLGKNFYRYINECRVTEARELLTTTDKSVIDIAFEVGFNSKATFNRTFKEITGFTPREVRQGGVSLKGPGLSKKKRITTSNETPAG